MEIEKVIGKTALELVQNESIINKSTDLLGMLFPFVGLKKKALDMYLSDIENSDLPSESKLMAVLNAKQTIKKFKNQSKVAELALANAPEGTDFSERSGVNEEWFDRFMDSAGFVSSEDVQLIWGKILAKEFENPGSTPSNMIRILTEITPTYAHAFRKICSMKTTITGECLMNITPTDTILHYDDMVRKYIQNNNTTKIVENAEYQVIRLNENQFEILKTLY